MRVAGIIAEYNPFHSGHEYQIQTLRELGYDAIVCVMSQSAVQRGEFAVLPPHTRARAAISAGADLVIALPAPCVLQSAEGFAAEGVRILSALGCVDTLCFGIECDDVNDIIKVAEIFGQEEYKNNLKKVLSNGNTYAAAVAIAAGAIFSRAKEILSMPNNILGTEYCKALIMQKSNIKPMALQRKGSEHSEELVQPKNNIASASALRGVMLKNDIKTLFEYVPKQCEPIYTAAINKQYIFNRQAFSTAVLSRLRAKTIDEFAQIQNVSEGLENRLFAAVQKSCNIDQLYDNLKTKRYTHSRVRRLALCAALDYKKSSRFEACYIHAIAANKVGLNVLSLAEKSASMPISSSLSSFLNISQNTKNLAKAHAACEDLAALCYNQPLMMGTAFTQRMIV